MLVAAVTLYLIANFLDVFIATWEYIDSASLQQFDGFYTVATDVSSLLSVVAAAARLPVYMCTDRFIREEIQERVGPLLHLVVKLCSATTGMASTGRHQGRTDVVVAAHGPLASPSAIMV